MTQDEMLALPAGRELDALVAERVLNWTLKQIDLPEGGTVWMRHGIQANGTHCIMIPVPSLSEDMGAAWQVVEHLMASGWRFDLQGEILDGRSDPHTWCAILIGDSMEHWYRGDADTAQLAICRAALLAVAGA